MPRPALLEPYERRTATSKSSDLPCDVYHVDFVFHRDELRSVYRSSSGSVEFLHERLRVLKNHHESWYQAKLIKAIKKELPHAVVLKIADKYLLGVPDLCVTFNGKTSWWELKVWRESREPKLSDFGKGVQLNMAQRLSTEGICFYIIFVDRKIDKRILIVDPLDIEILNPVEEYKDHDYEAAAEYVGWVHRNS